MNRIKIEFPIEVNCPVQRWHRPIQLTCQTESDETEHESESVEYPRTVFLHRVACLLISALFSAAFDCLPSTHKPTASTDTSLNNHNSGENRMPEPTTHTMTESHLFEICLELTDWLLSTFYLWQSGSVFTNTLRMDVESAVSLVFLLLPHADLDSQCFLVSLFHYFYQFIEMEPRVITPDLVRKVALFFARLGPSLPHKLVLSVEYNMRQMMAGKWKSPHAPNLEKAAELCRPILIDLVNRLESDVEGRREIAAQIWVIVASNDYYLLSSSYPLVPLLSVLSDATDDEAFFILRACTRTIAQAQPSDDDMFSMLLQHSSTILRFVKRMDRAQVVTEAWRLLLQLLVKSKEWFMYPRDGKADFLEVSKHLAMEFGETVERALQMREVSDETVGRETDFNNMLNLLGSSIRYFEHLSNIDFSPLILSLVPIVTPSQYFDERGEDSIWVPHFTKSQTRLSYFQPPSPFRFIPTLPSYPTEQSVLDDILTIKIAEAIWILRFGIYHGAKQAQAEHGKDQDWLSELHGRVEGISSTLDLHLLTTFQYPIDTTAKDTGLIRWALTDENRRDAVNPTNEEDWSPSVTCLSFSENLQFAAMWMLKGLTIVHQQYQLQFVPKRCRSVPKNIPTIQTYELQKLFGTFWEDSPHMWRLEEQDPLSQCT
ncbi:hypothetical protein BLNAU_9117 [Blattamonas nauphoetae]|uniref:Uncharacterized protein n=1 Tax=Blattamonas nauphoetae TaxID=2049346 RepID=A0ABQ9XWV6_9EUKA|nr:hypothetical protein BLNAU_9117 [Blattamonas nauphoetae]